MKDMKRICVYCGSNPGANPAFRTAARALGKQLAERGLGLVYGGASVGVMGAVADGVLENGGHAIGVLPHFFASKEIAHDGLNELIIVNSMHERKARMEQLSDGFIALPGGWGTIEEIFEVLTWSQLGHHQKPCGLLNVESYYDELSRFLENAIQNRFVKEEFRPMMMIEDEPSRLLDRFESYTAPVVKKWIGAEET
jgi:uncharacterized protein (TIGR00730 family)